jgi:PAS domain S-box-containing protein
MSLCDDAPVLLFALDREGTIIDASAATLATLGYERDDLVGTPYATLCSKEEASRALVAFEWPDVVRHQSRYLHRDGHMLSVFVNARRQEVCGGEPQVVLAALDVSDRVAIETELFQAHKLEAVGQLAAGIAHEINTPIQYIGDNLRFLQDSFPRLSRLLAHPSDPSAPASEGSDPEERDFLSSEIAKACAESLDGIEHIRRIVVAMKEFAHPDEQEMGAVDLNRVVETTLLLARNEWKHVAVLEKDLDPSLPMLLGRDGEIGQVVLNLLVNAAHAVDDAAPAKSGELGTIWVSTQNCALWAELRIRDSGTGIPAEVQPKIFDAFFTTKPVGKGTGQGLTLVRSLVQKHHGTIRFETEVGRGTTFIVRLPCLGVSEGPTEVAP